MKTWVVVAAFGAGLAGFAAEGALLWKFAPAPSALSPRAPLAPPRKVALLPLGPAPAALPFVGAEGVDADGYPRRVVSQAGFVRLLRHRRFDELTRYIEELQAAFEADPKKEYWVTDALSSFGMADAALEPLLNEWVKAHPSSFAPYGARGAYYAALGGFYRGGEFRSKTSRAQFEALQRELGRAKADHERAIALEPDALSSYVELIDDGRHTSEDRPAFERAVARFPLSFRVYYTAMMAATPRWGGSYAAMTDIARRADVHAAKNPRLKLLYGVVDYGRWQDLSTANDHLGALAATNAALKHGEHWNFYEARGSTKAEMKDFAGALKDYDQALALRPEFASLQQSRAIALHKLERWEEAGDAFLNALELAPQAAGRENREIYAGVLVFAANQHFNAGRPREALAAYDKALLLDPKHAEGKRWRAELLKRGDPNRAPQEVEQRVTAARRDDTFEAYLALDGALAQRGRFAEVIEHWNDFITRHPEEGRAYLERGGALFQIKKLPESLKDAEQACKLGVAPACSRADQVRNMLKNKPPLTR
jgi:tetratricopeptide (TPR) repeat protein